MKSYRAATVFLLLGLPLVLSGVARSGDLEDRARAAAKVAPGQFQLFYIPSSGEIADATFITVSKTRGPSSIAKQLSKILRSAENSSSSLAVSGPSDAKTAQVLTDAIRLLRGAKLDHVAIIFVGSKASASDVEAQVTSTGAKFVFAEY